MKNHGQYKDFDAFCLSPPFSSLHPQPRQSSLLLYDSVVTFAFPFVTLTPNCLAFAKISTRFREETACEILKQVFVSVDGLREESVDHESLKGVEAFVGGFFS